MRKLTTVLRRPAFLLLLLLVAALAFCKPVLLALPHEPPGRVLLELFVPWAVVVLVLALVGWGADDGQGTTKKENESERA
jgi:hypothetical protein